jgi:hypothetical protein
MSNADWRYEGVSFLFVSLFRAVVTRLCLCGTEAGLIPNDGVPLLFIEDATDGVTSIYFATRSQPRGEVRERYRGPNVSRSCGRQVQRRRSVLRRLRRHRNRDDPH